MTNFIEEQQRDATEDFHAMAKDIREYGEFPVTLEKHLEGYFLKRTNQTITNTLNHILESGLLEEKTVKELYPEANTEIADHKLACQVFGKECNNTLARAVKEFISNMDKK